MLIVEDQAVVETFECRDCGEHLPASLMSKDARRRSGIGSQCRACRQLYRLRFERPDGLVATNYLVEQAPDRGPAVRLRAALEVHRDASRPFRGAWPSAVAVALRELPLSEAISWRRTFNDTRDEWARGYQRASGGRAVKLDPSDALVFDD